MEPIHVPAPPKSAFNKQRPPSDLLVSQLEHFQHMEQRHEFTIDPALSKDLGTEAGVARYITAMTRAIRGAGAVGAPAIAAAPAAIAVVPAAIAAKKTAAKVATTKGLSLAASAKKSAAKKSAKKAATKAAKKGKKA